MTIKVEMVEIAPSPKTLIQTLRDDIRKDDTTLGEAIVMPFIAMFFLIPLGVLFVICIIADRLLIYPDKYETWTVEEWARRRGLPVPTVSYEYGR